MQSEIADEGALQIEVTTKDTKAARISSSLKQSGRKINIPTCVQTQAKDQ
jgi:hypothetical protein